MILLDLDIMNEWGEELKKLLRGKKVD